MKRKRPIENRVVDLEKCVHAIAVEVGKLKRRERARTKKENDRVIHGFADAIGEQVPQEEDDV